MPLVLWIGFTNATDRQKVQSFVNGSKRSGFCDNELEDFDTLCAASDERLFNTILNRPDHVLHPLLPPPNASKYQLRSRPHRRQLSQRTCRLIDCNFIVRLLHRDMYWLFIEPPWLSLCLCLVLKCVLSLHLWNYWLIDWLNDWHSICSPACVYMRYAKVLTAINVSNGCGFQSRRTSRCRSPQVGEE